ncbi:sensor histidine kinase [Methylobacterium nodulans]|uniref:histidine kinase n=1 Tax=Methylobacterium nodulans (strain LMG 21967 / CNCM I-2342 / ORS 2060) TaxID=460265 RepID=B8IEY6_METNO|nr:histidine kinase dimerization/phosphoacceptor domain -containing protein [Methylobacterium nodulans]ACL61479.1 signal transduction histidine kinase [Methylobacterium nodulans ORS 2060]
MRQIEVPETKRPSLSHRYDVAGIAPAPVFDEIVALATAIVDAPIAAISFVDEDHQWVQAVAGLPDGCAVDAGSICTHAVRADDLVVVRDLAADGQFEDYVRVHRELSVRFYAAVPLVAPDGGHVGTLCVLDRKPRDLTDRQRSLLKALARRVITELELRRSLDAERLARRDAEQLLEEKDRLLVQNEILLREVDHRVKNSLQLVSSMLTLQARQLPTGDAAKALDEACRRVASVAAAHEQLYRATASDRVDMSVFLRGICEALAATRPSNVEGIEIRAEPIEFGSKRAMKTGLLVAELVINGFKHAYPTGRRGGIKVELASMGPTARLRVSDEGVGLPVDLLDRASSGLGMRLIRSIVHQFGGRLTAEPGPGARVVIDIPSDETATT